MSMTPIRRAVSEPPRHVHVFGPGDMLRSKSGHILGYIHTRRVFVVWPSGARIDLDPEAPLTSERWELLPDLRTIPAVNPDDT